MEDEQSSTKIAKLTFDNYYAWKQKIELLLALKDLDDRLTDPKPKDEALVPAWLKKDKKAKALIGLTLSDEILESVRDVDSSASMWSTIKNIFERHTLLNKLTVRRKFYSATMTEEESVLEFCNRIRQLASTLKSMSVEIDESRVA